jgi:hypothetical protein
MPIRMRYVAQTIGKMPGMVQYQNFNTFLTFSKTVGAILSLT